MKINSEHFEFLRAEIIAKAPPAQIAAHRAWLLSPANPRPPKDLEKRLRWDLLHATVGAAWVCKNLYPYLNDTHIDTALRQIISSL